MLISIQGLMQVFMDLPSHTSLSHIFFDEFITRPAICPGRVKTSYYGYLTVGTVQ
jgi:hypothetical protein